MKKIVIIGGGTISHVRNHLALCAPAYGGTAKKLYKNFCTQIQIKRAKNEEFAQFDKKIEPSGGLTIFENSSPTLAKLLNINDISIELCLTKMANSYSTMETNDDVSNLVDQLIADPAVRVIIFNPALVDFSGEINEVKSDKHAQRLETSKGKQTMTLTPTDKIIGKIRKQRKDIFVVGFKTTTGATEQEQFLKGLELLKKNSINLVVANDTVTRNNIIITPEESKYHDPNRDQLLNRLVEMTLSRIEATFTRSEVLDGNPVDWNSEAVPENLRAVVNHCIKKGAYKPFLGKTAGHFAVKINDNEILTSIRKSNFNDLENVGLVKVKYDGLNTVKAFGAKPSVGGMSQRIIFKEHNDAECIVHFHVKPNADIDTLAWSDKVGNKVLLEPHELSIRPQIWNECGSTQCGQNTSDGLAKVNLGNGDYLKAVYLDNHGPNIVFSKSTPAEKIIDYIDKTFDFSESVGGLITMRNDNLARMRPVDHDPGCHLVLFNGNGRCNCGEDERWEQEYEKLSNIKNIVETKFI